MDTLNNNTIAAETIFRVGQAGEKYTVNRVEYQLQSNCSQNNYICYLLYNHAQVD